MTLPTRQVSPIMFSGCQCLQVKPKPTAHCAFLTSELGDPRCSPQNGNRTGMASTMLNGNMSMRDLGPRPQV